MSSGSIEQHAENFASRGFCVLDTGCVPFSRAEWATLGELVLGDPSRFVDVSEGDTREKARVLVHRLLHDGNPPVAAHPPLAAALLDIIGSPRCMALYERVLGTSPLMIRRAQAHVMDTGGFIGRHKDSESSSHYLAAVVLLLERAQAGGRFVIDRGGAGPIEIDGFAMLMTDADLPHEVLPVIEGRRSTLAFWLAHADS